MFILAMNLVRAGRADEAKAAFAALEALLEQLLAGDPVNVDYLRQRAAIWGQTGRHAEAAAAFADLAHGRGDISAYLNLSDELRKAGRFAESLEALDQGAGLGACAEGVRAQKAARIEAERSARTVSPCLP
jgi:predicted Zn-dependent protease